jgi:hypothetical protein
MTMDPEKFDRYMRLFGVRLSRRGLNGALVGALTTIGFSAPVRAVQKSTTHQTSPIHVICQNLGTACGNTAECQCRLDKSSRQTCQNVADPPDHRAFAPCQTNANCPDGQVCDAAESVCMSTCATPPLPPGPPPSGASSCQNLGTPCGNTAICQCRLDKSSTQTCQNVIVPPNGIDFISCDANDDCGPGQVCDASEGLCVSTCSN